MYCSLDLPDLFHQDVMVLHCYSLFLEVQVNQCPKISEVLTHTPSNLYYKILDTSYSVLIFVRSFFFFLIFFFPLVRFPSKMNLIILEYTVQAHRTQMRYGPNIRWHIVSFTIPEIKGDGPHTYHTDLGAELHEG